MKCVVCGADTFCSVNFATAAGGGGGSDTMEPRCDKHNPYRTSEPSVPMSVLRTILSEEGFANLLRDLRQFEIDQQDGE